MSDPTFMAIHSKVVETFDSRPQISTSWWKMSQRSIKVMRTHPLGNMNVSIKPSAVDELIKRQTDKRLSPGIPVTLARQQVTTQFFYLHVPDIEGLTLADEDRSDQPRGDVARRVHCAVVHPRQAAGVSLQRLVLLPHPPHVGVRLTRLNAVRLVAWRPHHEVPHQTHSV